MTFKLTAIICDDSRLQRKILRDTIEKENFSVVGEAESGDDAVNLCQEHHPNLLILDISMPGKGGIETLKEVKQLSPETKVVMVTAVDSDEIIVEALKIGADNYITKPYQAAKVARVINALDY